MQKRTKKLLWLVIVLLVAGVVGWLILGGKSGGEAEKYKTELRAKGERLSFSELGFPKPPEDGASLMQLTNAVGRIRRRGVDAGRYTNPNFAGPGRQRVLWRGDGLPLDQSSNLVGWVELSTSLATVTNELAEVRSAVETPPRWFLFNPAGYASNTAGGLKYPFVDMRIVAQCFYVDGLEALHADDLARVRQDHHALIQLAEFNREDPTLVAAMIRVAIAGLNLQLAWQALQHKDWTEADLLAMQRDWEREELLGAVESGFAGERAFTEMAFTMTRQRGLGWKRQTMTPGGPTKPWENMSDVLLGMLWNADQDELLALRHHQGTLNVIRALRAGRPWPEQDVAIKRQHQTLDKALGSAKGMDRFRFQLSAIVIPNSTKAVQTTVRHETQRRLTITAIALQRFHLQNQRWPEELEELVPEFISAIPLDPMNAEPLRYRHESESDFVLYSVGEDGNDDGGSPVKIGVAAQNDFWAVRDFVWPKPAD